MGIFLKALGIGLLVAGIRGVRHDIKEEEERKETICYFDGKISKEEFYGMVKRSGKGIRRITGLYAKETIVYGIVRSQSGLSNWSFTIDFNDYGDLTGKCWISTDNNDSNIPKIVADRIAQQILNYTDCLDDDLDDEFYHEKEQEEIHEQSELSCPYCGRQNLNENAKYCMYCGVRFRN